MSSSSSSGTPLGVILPSIVVPVIVILVVVVACVLLVVLIYRRKYRDKEKYLVAEMTQMETKKSSGNQLSEYFCPASDIMSNDIYDYSC